MQTDARVGDVVEGGQMAIRSSHGSLAAVDGGTRSKGQHQRHQHQAHIGTVSQLLAGGIAGAVSKTCTAPLARLTILFQLQGMHSDVETLKKACIWREASRIIREEGFRAFWKGNLVTIAHRLPYSSMNFYAYEQYKKVNKYCNFKIWLNCTQWIFYLLVSLCYLFCIFLQLLHTVPGLEKYRSNVSAEISMHFACGGLAGITAATATYPLDLVRTRLAAQTNVIYYRGIWHALRTIIIDEGHLGLYKGLGATLLTVGPSIAVSFSVYETLRSYWQSKRPHDSTVAVSLVCGSLSGIASSTEKQGVAQALLESL
ncbi:hypothetical protein SAY87_018362 [Trapa incisa]|uniref:Uncharacterized protein n=1 Tax=Trapa incisa TaxID=236973 RepID=A0AAN7QW50_9MYRT|nr:hypothetical protein SAY87_018362 [Trapa incisa]